MKFIKKQLLKILLGSLAFVTLTGIAVSLMFYQQNLKLNQNLQALSGQKIDIEAQFSSVSATLNTLQSEDQYQRNNRLEKEINEIVKNYKDSIAVYENLLKAKDANTKINKLDGDLAKVFSFLANRNYASASALMANINKDLETEKQKTTSSFSIPANIATDDKPPGSGYRRQSVQTDSGVFLVDIIAADLKSTKVIVDTASESDCTNDCPVMSVGDYAARNGAFAAVNGSFFCPSTYPSCAGKTNSFDTLLMNKNKKYFNSDNNVYSVVPAAIFGNGWVRFVGKSLEWGRDTSIDSMIANYPLLLAGGNSQFGSSEDQKITSKGARVFVATNGSMVYIGVVHNATTAEEVKVLKTLGMQDALGLDQGGSTALWYNGGYKLGPGRNIPNAILFVKR